MKMTSLHDSSEVILWFHDKDQMQILTENMDLAGDLVQSLANFLNIEHLMVIHPPNRLSDVIIIILFAGRQRQISRQLLRS